ncbi:MAG: hypothetical protein WD275_04140, partial [Rhodothermales bacterium]
MLVPRLIQPDLKVLLRIPEVNPVAGIPFRRQPATRGVLALLCSLTLFLTACDREPGEAGDLDSTAIYE